MTFSFRTPSSQIRRYAVWLVGLALLAALWLGVKVWNGKAAPAPAAPVQLPAVSVVEVKNNITTERLSVSGSLMARDPITVAAELDSRRVAEVLVDIGQYVKKGQPLVRLGTETLQADMQRATQQTAVQSAMLDEAKAVLDEANLHFTRTQTLFDKGFSNQAARDSASAALKTAQARLVAAERTLNATQASGTLVKATLQKAVIAAPANGIIASRQVFVGDTIRAGQSLFLLVKDNLVELRADVAESDLARLSIGLPAEVKPASTTRSVQGTIRLIVPQVDEKTRLAQVRIALPVDETLRVGGFASAEISLPHDNSLGVPITALQNDSGQDAVLVVAPDNVIAKRLVTTGRRIGNMVLITQGLNVGDQVVRLAGPFLSVGMKVQPVASNPE